MWGYMGVNQKMKNNPQANGKMKRKKRRLCLGYVIL